jgi:tetratricopeptide (TPR) repeat protein
MGSLGNYDGEVAEEKKAIALDARNASAHSNLGWAEAKKQRWHEALLAYQHSLTLAPTNVESQIGQALALFHSGKREAGIAAGRQAKTNAPHSAAPHIALGSMLQEQGRLEEAETELKAAITIAPDNLQARQQLASLFLQTGNSPRSIALFKQVLESMPSNATAHAGLSLALELQGDYAGAENEARKALDLNPKQQLAQVTLDRLAQKRSVK